MEPRFMSSVEVTSDDQGVWAVSRAVQKLADTVPPAATLRFSDTFGTPAKYRITATWYETERERVADLSDQERERL
jgi:hypothetical protein